MSEMRAKRRTAMPDFFEEDWGRLPPKKPLTPADSALREDRRWERIFDTVFGFLSILVFVPVLVAWFDTCWRFWAGVVLWCAGSGQAVLHSSSSAVPWLLTTCFAILALRRHRGWSDWT